MEEKFQRKLQLLMKNEGISQSRLAEMLEVKPSTLSHILAGRNYPGFDMLQKLRRLFPHINADWLLLDSSEDYLANAPTAPTAPTASPASGRGDVAAGSAAGRGAGVVGNMRTAGSAAGVVGPNAGAVQGARTVGSAAGVVGGARSVGAAAGAVGATGSVGGSNAQGMATAPSLFDVPSLSDDSPAGMDAASSTVSAQMLSSLDRADGVRIRRIIVLYEDNSFESFTPRP